MSKTKNHLEEILQAARNLFIKYNYDSVSMSNIASKLEISKAALYYYFNSKKELYLFIIDSDFECFKNKIEEIIGEDQKINDENFKEKTEKLIEIVYGFILKKLGLILYLHRNEHKSPDLKEITKNLENKKEELLKILKPLSEKILEYKKTPKIINHQDMSMFIMVSINAFALQSCSTGTKNKTSEIVKKISLLILN
jgi:AcrR family transcriptional regulator